MKYLIFLIAIFSFGVGFSQQFTVSGSITDLKNGEDLFGASVAVKELANTGAQANVYGFYSLSIPKGTYTFVYRYSGYDEVVKTIDL